ncbi:MAG: transglutaminase-like domain-containing protein [Nanoarchaeota archaeon]
MEEGIEQEPHKSPIWYVIGPLLILLVLIFLIPDFAFDVKEQPKDIPSLEEVRPQSLFDMDITEARASAGQLGSLEMADDQMIKIIADTVAAKSCQGDKTCQAKSLYLFVRDNIDYISDPSREYIKSPHETLLTGGGDCDDMAVLLWNLEEAIGVQARYGTSPNHLFVEISLPEAPEKYKKDGWIALDATCKSCTFGEVGPAVFYGERAFI